MFSVLISIRLKIHTNICWFQVMDYMDMLKKKVISDIVHDSSLSLQEKTETLIARANQSGGYDNCTVILMENDGE